MVNNPLNLDETAEWVGLWWLPDNPDKRIPGTLRYDGQGSLSLIGEFEDYLCLKTATGGIIISNEALRWDVIHGVCEQLEITLLNCALPSDTQFFYMLGKGKGTETQTMTAEIAIIGAHISGMDDAEFTAVEVSVEGLGFWAASSAFMGPLGASDCKSDKTGTTSVSPIEAQTVTVDSTEYRLAHTHTLSFLDHHKSGTVGRMRDTTFISACRPERFTLSAALEEVRLILNLISLATNRAAGVFWLQLEVAGSNSVSANDHPLPRRQAAVLYSPLALGKHDAKAADPNSAFFTCDVIPFEKVIPRWCKVRGHLQTATNMILSLRYAPARFIENNLLTAVGAAEVLHRGLDINVSPFLKNEFKKIRDAMLDQVPEEHRDRFKGMIRNDPTLRDRLCALADRLDDEAIAQLLPDKESWAKRTTRARNDLAHEGKAPTHSIEELNAIVEATTAVVILNILSKIGVPADQQIHIVKTHPQLRKAADAARAYLVDSKPEP